MADDSWEYGAGVEIDQKIMDDYESPDFDISEVVDDYEAESLTGLPENGGDQDDSFINPDEKLKDWEFDGLQVEKHSKGSRRKRRKKEREAAEKQAEEAKADDEAAQVTDDAKAAGEACKDEEEKTSGEAREDEEEKAAEEARKAEEEQQAAFERISRTVQAPIASAIVGNAPDTTEEVPGEGAQDADDGEESNED